MGMKIAGAVCIIAACTAMGFSFSFRLRCRYGELTELKKILYLLSGEIRFGGSTLDEAFEMVRDRCEEPYRGFFSALSGELKKGGGRTLSQIWREAVNEKLPGSRLSREDRNILQRVGEDLGCLDKETQLKSLSLSIEQLDGAGKALYAELPKKMKLYNYLGILTGVFLTIFLI